MARVVHALALSLALSVAAGAAPAVDADFLAQARQQGIRFAEPVTVRFDWKLARDPREAQAVREMLVREGFTVSSSVTTRGDGSAPEHRVSATRTGVVGERALRALMERIAPLTRGPGTVEWGIEQAR